MFHRFFHWGPLTWHNAVARWSGYGFSHVANQAFHIQIDNIAISWSLSRDSLCSEGELTIWQRLSSERILLESKLIFYDNCKDKRNFLIHRNHAWGQRCVSFLESSSISFFFWCLVCIENLRISGLILKFKR